MPKAHLVMTGMMVLTPGVANAELSHQTGGNRRLQTSIDAAFCPYQQFAESHAEVRNRETTPTAELPYLLSCAFTTTTNGVVKLLSTRFRRH